MLGRQGFQYDTKELVELIAEANADINEKLLEETKSTTKAIEVLDEPNVLVKASKLMNKNGLNDSSLIRLLAKLLVS